MAVSFRENHIDHPTYKRNELALMKDVADSKLEISPMIRSIERARYLIEYVGVIKKRALRTGDSIQLVTALEMSSLAKDIVVFVTCDVRLSRIVNEVDVFQLQLRPLFLQS